jgi:predicted dehydrogenase
MMDLSGHNRHTEFDLLLADSSVDMVDLCVPNDEHAKLAIRALEAGKHVLVEKPIALSTADADAMLAASRSSGKLLMVAHVLPFFPEFAFAAEAVRSGRYGKLKAAHFTRLISRPDWSTGIADALRSGGPAIDLHIHDTHFIGLVCGVPDAVQSSGVVEDGAVSYIASQYLYDKKDIAVSAVSGAISQSGRPFAHGFEVYLERATLSYEFASLGGAGHLATHLSVILPDGTVERPELAAGGELDAFTAELDVAVKSVTMGNTNSPLAGTLARQALVTCLAEVESVRSRRPVLVL